MEEIPESDEEDDSGSEDEWLPEKEGLVYSSSSDNKTEDAEGAGQAEEVHGVPPDRAQGQKKKQKYLEDNHFQGDLLPFLGEGKVNVEGTEPVDFFFMHLFPEDLITEIVNNTNKKNIWH